MKCKWVVAIINRSADLFDGSFSCTSLKKKKSWINYMNKLINVLMKPKCTSVFRMPVNSLHEIAYCFCFAPTLRGWLCSLSLALPGFIVHYRGSHPFSFAQPARMDSGDSVLASTLFFYSAFAKPFRMKCSAALSSARLISFESC